MTSLAQSSEATTIAGSRYRCSWLDMVSERENRERVTVEREFRRNLEKKEKRNMKRGQDFVSVTITALEASLWTSLHKRLHKDLPCMLQETSLQLKILHVLHEGWMYQPSGAPETTVWQNLEGGTLELL
ncbi:hypothetical protein L484_004557 [Morus notabilis]|uniref:Uncharacterized protein n=1 Tax=Morus notabilis TaxID=981085 RepID=W9QJ82_9ROSA|nr:hypothetical protein L484_004557 [Morus notabilis]